MPGSKYQDGLTLRSALGMFLRGQTGGSRRGLGRLGPTRSGAHSASQPNRKTVSISQLTAENALGSASKAQKPEPHRK